MIKTHLVDDSLATVNHFTKRLGDLKIFYYNESGFRLKPTATFLVNQTLE